MTRSTVKIIPLEPLAVRPKNACKLIGVSLRKFAEMRASGLLPKIYKLGGCSVIRTADLKQWAAWEFPCLDRFLALQKEEAQKCARQR
jgi:hypothetical protein